MSDNEIDIAVEDARWDQAVPELEAFTLRAVAGGSAHGELPKQFRTAGHPRLHGCAEYLDDPRGVVHVREFVEYLAAQAEAAPRRPVPQAVADGEARGEIQPAPRPRRAASA